MNTQRSFQWSGITVGDPMKYVSCNRVKHVCTEIPMLYRGSNELILQYNETYLYKNTQVTL